MYMQCIFFNFFNHLAELGPNPFSEGKPCDDDSNCNMPLGVTCCGVGELSGRCCPDGLCRECNSTGDPTKWHYCGTYCPDFPKTTQVTPPYLSTTTSHGPSTTSTTTTTTTKNDTMFEWDEEFSFILLAYEDEDY